MLSLIFDTFVLFDYLSLISKQGLILYPADLRKENNRKWADLTSRTLSTDWIYNTGQSMKTLKNHRVAKMTQSPTFARRSNQLLPKICVKFFYQKLIDFSDEKQSDLKRKKWKDTNAFPMVNKLIGNWFYLSLGETGGQLIEIFYFVSKSSSLPSCQRHKIELRGSLLNIDCVSLKKLQCGMISIQISVFSCTWLNWDEAMQSKSRYHLLGWLKNIPAFI